MPQQPSLARGLLRNGKAIDFARPDRAPGGSESTTAKIINLVHDMVPRRDREAEQRENFAANLRILRAEESRRVLEVERMQNGNVELTRSGRSKPVCGKRRRRCGS